MLTPAQNDRLRALFAEAIDLPVAGRAAFCVSRCADDPVLRAELESLLALEAEDDDSFLARGPVGGDEPERIGPYLLLDRIGEGGMGIVYRARQQAPVRREVALKVIKPGMDSQRVVSRFDAERQALALMDHPSIARIHDAGATDTGRPYFVMELVQGEHLTAYCDRVYMGMRDRLRLFCRVCDAVQHAHQKGIVHRDLKPSNVLVTEVDGQPSPKIIDFGIARAIADPGDVRATFTGHGELVGTLQYMSPEQAAGSADIDARADIYALGVVLYELITGELPLGPETFAGKPITEVQRILREQEPRKPSTRIAEVDTSTEHAARRGTDSRALRRSLTGDLDWITLVALDKDRERRYASASELAADVRRYLAHEPVTAGPPSNWYRLRKFARRNRGMVASVGLVCVTFVAGLGGTVSALFWALDEKEKATAAETRATEARTAAEDSARVAARRAEELEKVVAFQTAQLSGIDAVSMGGRIWSDLEQRAREAMERERLDADEVGRQIEVLERLLSGVDFTDVALDLLRDDVFGRALQTIDTQFGDQPTVQARLLLSVAQTMEKLGLHAAAVSPATRAYVLGESHLGERDDVTLAAMLLAAYLRVHDGGSEEELAEVERLLLDAEARIAARGGPPDGITVEVSRTLSLLHMHQADHPRAIAASRAAVAAAERAFGPDRVETAHALRELGNRLSITGALDESEPFLERAARIFQAVGEETAAIAVRGDFARLLIERGDPRSAIPLLEDEARALQKALGDGDQQTLESLTRLAAAYLEVGRLVEARDTFARVIAGWDTLLAPGAPLALHARDALGAVESQLGNLDAAEGHLQAVYETLLRQHGSDHVEVVEARGRLAAMVWMRQGRRAEAEEPMRRALAAMEAVHGEDSLEILDEIVNLGLLLKQLGQLEEAEVLQRRSLRIHQANGHRLGTSVSAFNLACVVAERGDFVEAEGLFALAVDAYREAMPGEERELQKMLFNHAYSLIVQTGREAEVAALLEESFTLARRACADQPFLVADRAGWCGKAFLRALQPGKAVGFFRVELEMMEQLIPDGSPDAWRRHYARYNVAVALVDAASLAHNRGEPEVTARHAREAVSAFEAAAQWIYAQPPIHAAGAEGPELAIEVGKYAAHVYGVMQVVEPDAGHEQSAAEWAARLAARQQRR